jgi:hypothetical protein
MFSKFLVFGICLVLFSFAQSCNKNEGSGNGNSRNDSSSRILFEDMIPNDLEITLKRASGNSTNPTYSLKIDSNGTVIFDGKIYTGTKGKAEDKVDKQVVLDLIREFEKVDFFGLKDSYVATDDGCGEVLTDMASESISIKVKGKIKSVNHDYGCKEFQGGDLERITSLGKKIDELVNSKKWIKGWKPGDIEDN